MKKKIEDDPFGYQKKLKAAVKKINKRVANGEEIPFRIDEITVDTIVKAEYTDDWGGEAYITSKSTNGKIRKWNYGSMIFNIA